MMGDGAVPGTALRSSARYTPNEQGTVWKDGTWVPILDGDFDPMYGDLGKLDSTLGVAMRTATADGNADNIRDLHRRLGRRHL